MTNDEDRLVQIEWRLLQMMAERRIKQNTLLVQKLRDIGVDISTAQLGRLVDRFPDRLNTETLRGLLTVLDCDITDLMRVHPPNAANLVQGDNQVYPVPGADKPAPTKRAKRGARKAQSDKGAGAQQRVLPDGFDDFKD
jgi:DNA-binding Xre family transcriptional regulator